VAKGAWQPEGVVALIYGKSKDKKQALAIEPGLHNVLGLERYFKKQPVDMDFLNPFSSFFHLKNLSTQIYLRFLKSYVESIPDEAMVLDAGCGVGRFTTLWAERFKKVVAFDPSLPSLKTCQRHLNERGLNNVELHWADISFLDNWEGDLFDAVFAMELICYTADPLKSLKRLIRIAKPNAKIFLSVEGRLGALCAQGVDEPKRLMEVISEKPLLLENDRFAVYFDRDGCENLVCNAGLKEVVIESSHYFGEGVFWQSIDDSRLDDQKYVEMIIQAEDFCRDNPSIAELARVFIAVGKK
jgi:ubiquinone/menaquinone biosynthesis C-methylase UbiE